MANHPVPNIVAQAILGMVTYAVINPTVNYLYVHLTDWILKNNCAGDTSVVIQNLQFFF